MSLVFLFQPVSGDSGHSASGESNTAAGTGQERLEGAEKDTGASAAPNAEKDPGASGALSAEKGTGTSAIPNAEKEAGPIGARPPKRGPGRGRRSIIADVLSAIHKPASLESQSESSAPDSQSQPCETIPEVSNENQDSVSNETEEDAADCDVITLSRDCSQNEAENESEAGDESEAEELQRLPQRIEHVTSVVTSVRASLVLIRDAVDSKMTSLKATV